MVIETERLLLREYTTDDYDALYEIVSDPETMQHYPAPFDEARIKTLDRMESGKLCAIWFWIVGGGVERDRRIHRGLWADFAEYRWGDAAGDRVSYP